MDFPRPPPSMDGKTSDLMKRVGEFLPKIAEANQDLDSADIQLDTTLVEDKSDDDDESGDESDDDAESKPSARTIDLKFAVGNFNESPEMALLDRNGEEEGTEKQQEQANGRAGEKRPASLKQHNDSTNTTDASSCKKSKPLIQELS